VNQLLSKLDGVDEMNNVLVICLTNRKDLIDSALLRPGRLEVHIEIKAPDLQGREEILYILFKPMVLGGYVTIGDAKKWIKWVAGRTFGYTGADLTGLVRNAASHAIERTLEQQHNHYSKNNDSSKDNNNDDSRGNESTVNINTNKDNGKNDKSMLFTDKDKVKSNSNSDVTIENNQFKPFEDSIEILWNDIEKAFFESKKEMKISKRAQFMSFLNSTLRRKDKNNDNKKIKKREFEDILNSVDVEVEVEELESLDRDGNENSLIDDNINPIKPAFQNIGGTLIF
jgi:SpoVK/Ycf46/Vps4 family AAA+-type ATPase